jgi:superfamily II DNA or RNA helicase
MQYPKLYADIYQKLSEKLDPDDAFSLSLCCKAAYRAFKRPDIQKKISFPMLQPKRLTMDQRNTIKEMEKVKIPVKLICAPVGGGKTLVSLAYALRNNFDKIFVVVPPNLITMWDKTSKEFFGITPLILHNTNSKYNFRQEVQRETPPEERIILMSYMIFGRYSAPWMNERKSDVCIIDEAHHSLYFRNKQFKEIIALSATPFKKSTISRGVAHLMQEFEVEIADINFVMEKNVIAKQLPPVHHLPPHSWKITEELVDYIKKRLSVTLEGNKDLRDIKWIPEVLSHPYLANMPYVGHSLSVGKKSFSIPSSSIDYVKQREIQEVIRKEFEKEHGLLQVTYVDWQADRRTERTYFKKLEKFQQEYFADEINTMIRKNDKYRQCLTIAEYLKKKKEKAIIFDINITYLPFLFKYLTDRGVKAYMFTTHYDVSSRQKQLEKFKSDPDAQVLLSSVAMLGEGHNITEANHIITLTPFLDANKYKQIVGRCHRYPQNKPVYIHHLFNSGFDRGIYSHSLGDIDLAESDWMKLLRE